MELRDLQLKELDILKECLKIFQKYNLRYFMLGGTFLGAVRHKGFIPWDDDIDIGMPRDDYEQFCEIAKRELIKPFFCSSFRVEKSHNGYCCRVVNTNVLVHRDDAIIHKTENLWIDIFPLDGMPDSNILCFFHKMNLLFKRLLLQYSKFENGINMKKKRKIVEAVLIKIGYMVSRVFRFDVKKRLFAIDKLLRRYKYDTSNYVVNFMGAYKFKEMFPRYLYENITEYQFEDLMLPAPKDYDAILSQMYGDYMNPPPQNQRFSHSIQFAETEAVGND